MYHAQKLSLMEYLHLHCQLIYVNTTHRSSSEEQACSWKKYLKLFFFCNEAPNFLKPASKLLYHYSNEYTEVLSCM